MYRLALPRCTVTGPTDPAPYAHLMRGHIPRKCITCEMLFEGGCTRSSSSETPYRNLDHGPCPIMGAQHAVFYEDSFVQSKVSIPQKCQRCPHLRLEQVRGFFCNLDREIWRDFPRGLDWGLWSPERPNLELLSGRSMNQEFLNAVERSDQVQAIRVFREIHPNSTIKEARESYVELSSKA